MAEDVGVLLNDVVATTAPTWGPALVAALLGDSELATMFTAPAVNPATQTCSVVNAIVGGVCESGDPLHITTLFAHYQAADVQPLKIMQMWGWTTALAVQAYERQYQVVLRNTSLVAYMRAARAYGTKLGVRSTWMGLGVQDLASSRADLLLARTELPAGSGNAWDSIMSSDEVGERLELSNPRVALERAGWFLPPGYVALFA